MGRMVKRLSNLEIDEVSLVDRPANQHGLVAIAKADTMEDSMSVYDADGREVEESQLQVGDFVYDGEGNEFQVTDGDGAADEGHEEEEVGKSNPFKLASRFGVKDTATAYGNRGKRRAGELVQRAMDSEAGQHVSRNKHRYGYGGTAAAGAGAGYGMSKSLGDTVMESLSKALTQDDRDEVISKAMDALEDVAKRNEQLEEVVANLIEERETEQFGAIAKSYGLPGEDADLGGLLHRASQELPEEDVIALDRLFTAAGTVTKAYYDEIGITAPGADSDILGQVYAMAGEVVVKNADAGITQEQAVTALFSQNPEAYDEYLAETQGR